MESESIIDAFVATIILGVMIVIAAQAFEPEIGKKLADLLPLFVQVITWLFIVLIIGALLAQLVEKF